MNNREFEQLYIKVYCGYTDYQSHPGHKVDGFSDGTNSAASEAIEQQENATFFCLNETPILLYHLDNLYLAFILLTICTTAGHVSDRRVDNMDVRFFEREAIIAVGYNNPQVQ